MHHTEAAEKCEHCVRRPPTSLPVRSELTHPQISLILENSAHFTSPPQVCLAPPRGLSLKAHQRADHTSGGVRRTARLPTFMAQAGETEHNHRRRRHHRYHHHHDERTVTELIETQRTTQSNIRDQRCGRDVSFSYPVHGRGKMSPLPPHTPQAKWPACHKRAVITTPDKGAAPTRAHRKEKALKALLKIEYNLGASIIIIRDTDKERRRGETSVPCSAALTPALPSSRAM
ncbi:hypothetical protein E2C01_063577 [Portunus trituberculatus]|uniref:Uncharacterized protein n=1 Tax=Portunus trituberculatus TaxID=210409 RepID=A0A5B7HL96_PORTR|nr:hypothetical protein [Portunus trituberculatus]